MLWSGKIRPPGDDLVQDKKERELRKLSECIAKNFVKSTKAHKTLLHGTFYIASLRTLAVVIDFKHDFHSAFDVLGRSKETLHTDVCQTNPR